MEYPLIKTRISIFNLAVVLILILMEYPLILTSDLGDDNFLS